LTNDSNIISKALEGFSFSSGSNILSKSLKGFSLVTHLSQIELQVNM